MTTPPVTDLAIEQGPMLTPIQFQDGYVPGQYASFDVSPEPMFGPDELGEYKSAIDDLSETCTRADVAARLWEVLLSWESRHFSRGYHYLQSGRGGLSMFGGMNSTRAGGAEILQTQNAMKMFACNVYGAREDKIVAALSREVPGVVFVPKRDSDPMDQTASDEAKKYLPIWMNESAINELVGDMARLQYTDGRIVLYTRSVADEQSWGTESAEQEQEVFDPPAADGVSPETELMPDKSQSEQPAVREMTTAHGVLEAKVPLYADSQGEMAWVRLSKERSVNILKERYPWIEDKIKAGSSLGQEQLDKQARINVRLAVQSTSTSGESWQQDATEAFTWYRPSQYRAIKDKDVRKLFYDNFPDGLLVVHAGNELAFVRNESMNKHLTVIHAKHGSGQNRRAIGSNYLPMQKILNTNLNLIHKYFVACVPRRFVAEGSIDTQEINSQGNNLGITPVILQNGMKIQDLTGIEAVPQPTTGLMEFVQWLISGAPEVMDGCEPSMFGGDGGEADQGVFQTARLKRDQALQVLSMPWKQICNGIAKAAEQAVECAAQNRVANIQSNIPGQGKLEVELSKLQGDTLCYPESLEIPQTIAEQEAQMASLLENAKNVALYQAIVSDPRNLAFFSKFPSLAGLEISGLDAVEQQQGEFELLMQSGPLPNPQLAQAQQQVTEVHQQIVMAEFDPEAQSPQGQQALQQLQASEEQLLQQIQTLPPLVSSVPVAQNTSENHAIHGAITLGMMNSAEGRKLKHGNEQQQQIYQNLELHWQEHEDMSQKLTPPKEMEFKGSVSIDPSKYAPEAQAKMLQAAGLQVAPTDLQGDHSLVPHEVTTEKEGVNADGVPVKQKIAMVNPSGKLR